MKMRFRNGSINLSTNANDWLVGEKRDAFYSLVQLCMLKIYYTMHKRSRVSRVGFTYNCVTFVDDVVSQCEVYSV